MVTARSASLADLILERGRNEGSKPAIICADGRHLSYGELGDQVDALGRLIREIAEPDDILGLRLDDELEIICHYLGAMSADRVVDLGPGQSGCSLLASDRGIQRVGQPVGHLRGPSGMAVVIRTSGSSGEPRRTVHSNRGLLSAIWHTGAVVDELLLPNKVPRVPQLVEEMVEVLLQRSPLGLTYLVGLNVRSVGALSVMNRALATGDTILLPRSIAAQDIAEACGLGISISNLGLAPFTAQQLVRIWQGGHAALPAGVLSCGLGGAGVRPEVCEALEVLLSAPVTCAYGSTELGGVALMGRPWEPPEIRWHSVGVPLPGIGATIDGVGSVGELRVTSSAAMVGTLDDRNELVEYPSTILTGDLASHGSQGEYRIHGRADYVIMRAGHRIDPVRVEQALESDPRVRRAGVTGRASRLSGEFDVVAIVELDGVLSAPGLRRVCSELLHPHEVPGHVVIVSSVPTTRDGKPDRSALPALAE